MTSKNYLSFLFLLISFTGFGQYFTQYFDGADTSSASALFVRLDTAAGNIWQIGEPQKSIFDSAATVPNALITDTVNFYPTNNISIAGFSVMPGPFFPGILAIQWKQKLDMDHNHDGGIIEFSLDSGTTWSNAFNNPYVYNFYGYDFKNVDTLDNGQVAFSGTDSVWKDIWLCYDQSWLTQSDSLMVRFTFLSDSVDNNKEGWIIDNLTVHPTFVHTISEVKQEEYLVASPNPTSGKIQLQAQKLDQFHLFEKMELYDSEGQLVQTFGSSPTKFDIDISRHASGVYYLKVYSNVQTETLRIVLQK